MLEEKLNLDKLKSHLWESANILRGSIDSSDYKQYIFGMLFLKRLSDVFEEERERIREEDGEDFVDKPLFYDFYVPEKARWEHISSVTEDIGATLNKAFEALEEENPTLEGVLVSIDFNDKERLPDTVLDGLIQHFSEYSLGNQDLEDPDLLGRAYEYLIDKFADDAGKKGGEFYTPQEVVKLLVKIADPQPNHRIYDPCCGSGGMLIYSAENLREKGYDTSEITLYGQEKNLNTWAICKMNMLLHGHYDAQIAKGDTMIDPEFTEGGSLQQFDRVLANPMWNQKRWHKEELKDSEPFGRFKYGYPPKNKADWAWIQHMLASTTVTGQVGVVFDNGVLFRSRSEGKIRKKVLQDDLVEAVIALPANLFANTSSPGCILILNKDKAQERKDKVIFIYAEEDYEELSNQNKLRAEDIEKIVNAYQEYEDREKYCRVVDLEEIERNDFNLNVPRYVDTTEPEEPVDINQVLGELDQLEQEYQEIDSKVDGYLGELGYDA
ncbi:type I restriction-modification system subunit M [Natroniella sp. ANB-PHB2]|uniref:type I restriction-modification system subunit M n=1 Tax=Natroniella sp. ANB-PHB2 TaxID=3384444 RepID=UPI0038D4EB92